MIDPDELAQNVTTCPCRSCWDQVATYVDDAVKAAGGVGLFFSFTEVMTSRHQPLQMHIGTKGRSSLL